MLNQGGQTCLGGDQGWDLECGLPFKGILPVRVVIFVPFTNKYCGEV